jgi:hypothetical protein
VLSKETARCGAFIGLGTAEAGAQQFRDDIADDQSRLKRLDLYRTHAYAHSGQRDRSRGEVCFPQLFLEINSFKLDAYSRDASRVNHAGSGVHG